MATITDDNNGIIKVYWADIRERVAQAEPVFADIVDQLNPDKTFPLYLVYLPYGALKGDTTSSYFPDGKGGYYRLSDPEAPKGITKDLGYGSDGSPMGMVLEKQLEYFIDLKHKGITIPWLIYSPGQFFPFSTILGCKSRHVYAPNGLLTVTSGVRSTFMLPNIGCNSNYVNLRRDFNVQRQAPKSLYEHWYVFKEIIQSNVLNCHWRSCLMYFSEKWVNKLHSDKAWISLKLYLHEVAWRKFEYERNRVYYDIAFSIIQEKRNLKPNPYLTDTARHLFTTALGGAPGYVPSCNNDALPANLLQRVFLDCYGLKKYIPTLMQPAHFDFEKSKYPVYYSLQNPSTYVFSPKSREGSSTIVEILELEHIMNIFCEELANDSNICSDTIIGKIAKNVNFNYFHNKADRQAVIRPSSDIPFADKRFEAGSLNGEGSIGKFAADAPFVRGCISIDSKDNKSFKCNGTK
ncbi:hypothetical protein [Aquicella lusitana]|uniref:Uncharacterized protein n=1 Tax=Aquicella lusitana TaxID=254246 RepID=A0A370GX63_9COXI|nr:hypothetical protein [Aquicella lusitana]RDI48069.1 hypothetical protein C8D86_10334 [Aquicella lusitana]VVC72915.1 hypothetical protein AQULUS_06390 [Aquicella lusitana]